MLALRPIVLAATALAAVIASTSVPTFAQGQPIDIGIIASYSGAVGAQGSEFANAAKLAVEEINKSGGIAAINNRPLRLTVFDDTSGPATARTLAIKLISDNKVSAIVGPYGSGVCLAVGPVVEQQQIPTICSGQLPVCVGA